MKFQDFLIRPTHQAPPRRITLQKQVEELQERLQRELKVNSVLRWAMKGPVLSFHSLPPELPFQVKALLTELAMAEEHIMWLERKLRKLKLTLNHHNDKNNAFFSSPSRPKTSLDHQHNRIPSIDRANHRLVFSSRTHGTPRLNAIHPVSYPGRLSHAPKPLVSYKS